MYLNVLWHSIKRKERVIISFLIIIQAHMKNIPDFEIELAQSIEYILGSALAKKAMEAPPYKNYTNIVIDIVRSIDRLADNCHMPEFTNHAMPHICSIVKRASEWAEYDGWLKRLNSAEAAYLLVALLIHDIGMLSQDSKNIPDAVRMKYMKGCSDIPNWVRRTHVIRIEKLIKRLLEEYRKEDEELDGHLGISISIAMSHEKWPWEDDYVAQQELLDEKGLVKGRIRALNAVLAVCDLLDEDSNRCDTMTLIRHRHGSTENMAHWIRHALTKEVIGVKEKKVQVRFRRLVPSEESHEIIYRALRNHYRLVRLYNPALKELDAEIKHIEFLPSDGIPEDEDDISQQLGGIWPTLPEFKYSLVGRLLQTFMKEALNMDGGDKQLRCRLDEVGLETLSLADVEEFLYPNTLMMEEEKIIYGEGTTKEHLDYMKELAEDACVNGKIGQLRSLCAEALEIVEADTPLEQIYWAVAYLGVYSASEEDLYQLENKYTNVLEPAYRREKQAAIKAEGAYQSLIDVLLKFLQPEVSGQLLIKYRDHLLAGEITGLKDDTATALLLETVIGMFWYHAADTNMWEEVAEYYIDALKDSVPGLSRTVAEMQGQLHLQCKIFQKADYITEEEIKASGNPVFARAWIYFYRAEWSKAVESYKHMVRIAERNTDYFCPVQGYGNIVFNIWHWENWSEEKSEKGVPVRSYYRYQRACLEHGLPSFWQNRESKIEMLLSECRQKPQKTVGERTRAVRLISLRQLEALRYWNLGEYIESVRNEARLAYEVGMYQDKYANYCGILNDLPMAVIHAIRGISNREFSEEEKQALVLRMQRLYPEGIEQVIKFITNDSCRIHWEFASGWLKYLTAYVNKEQVGKLVDWLVQYDAFEQTQLHHFNLSEFMYLQYMLEMLEEEQWKELKDILGRSFKSVHFFMSNSELCLKILCTSPKALCLEFLEQIYGWEENVYKQKAVYSICIELIKSRKEELGQEVKNFLKQCRKNGDCSMYQDLEILLDVQSLSELTELDLAGAEESLAYLLEDFKTNGMTGYNSQRVEAVGSKFGNKNWSIAPEEDVLRVVGRIQDLLKEYRQSLSRLYFKELCHLLTDVARTGTASVRREIARFMVQEYVLNKKEADSSDSGWPDGPFQTVHMDFGEYKAEENGVMTVLIHCLRELPDEHKVDCINYSMQQLRPDRLEQYQFATILFSYLYLTEQESSATKQLALSGLMLIRGELSVQDKNFEKRYQCVVKGVQCLENADMWFIEKSYLELEQEDTYYRTMFTDKLVEWKDRVFDPDVAKWREKAQK